MFRKLALSSMTLLAMTPVVASVLPQASVSANTQNVSKVSTQQLREIGGRFTASLVEGMGTKPFSIGTVEYVIPPTIILDVSNGGPESLSWSAAIYDVTSNSVVSDWKEFSHGYNALSMSVDRSKVSLGDNLQVWLHANSGSGTVSFSVLG